MCPLILGLFRLHHQARLEYMISGAKLALDQNRDTFGIMLLQGGKDLADRLRREVRPSIMITIGIRLSVVAKAEARRRRLPC